MNAESSRSTTFTEKLVAYLDGELPDDAAREVEQTLASDPTMRAEVEQLNRAWELLDLLPRPRASSEFSSRTLATLQVTDVTTDLAAEPDTTPTLALETGRVRRWSVSPWWICVGGWALICLLGFVVGRHSARSHSEEWLDDLPVLEHFDVYREIGDERFLRELKRKGVFDERRPPEPR